MRKQTRAPTKVILSIPNNYSRFDTHFALPYPHDDLLVVNDLGRDFGPLSKYMGVMKVADDRAIVVIGDDDVNYAATFIEDFVAAIDARHDTEAVFTHQFDDGFGSLSPGVKAYSGVGCYAGQLRRLVHRYLRRPVPHPCFLADDVVATHYFKVLRPFKLYPITLRSPNPDDTSIWRSNSSINAFHVSKGGNHVNLDCEHALTTQALRKQPQRRVPTILRAQGCAVDPEAATIVTPGSTGVGPSWWQTY